jgi:hypothetical protein
MEDIQEIPSSSSSEDKNISPSVQALVPAPVISSVSTSAGDSINASIHAPGSKTVLNKGKAVANPPPTVSKPIITPLPPFSEWKTVEKRKTFQIAIALENLVGTLVDDKKNYAYNMIGHLEGRTCFELKTINGIKAIGVSYETQVQAAEAMKIPVSAENPAHFESVEQFKNADRENRFFMKIFDVPLNIDKKIFNQYLDSLDKTSSIKYMTRGLFYHVYVTFATKKLTATFNNTTWSMMYEKLSFRVFPDTLTNEDYALRKKYTLKLSHLPKSTTPFDLKQILHDVRAKTCFIPKNTYNTNYQHARFAYVSFATEAAMKEAKRLVFVLNNQTLLWTDPKARLCNECGSSNHLRYRCKEASKKQRIVDNNSKFSPVYQRFNVKPNMPKGYVPPSLGPTPDFDNINDSFHDWDTDNNALPKPQKSFADVIKGRPTKPPHNPNYLGTNVHQPAKFGMNPGDGRRFWNQQNLNKVNSQYGANRVRVYDTPVKKDVNQRLDRLEQMMEKFLTQMNTVMDRLGSIEVSLVSAQPTVPRTVDTVFTDVNTESTPEFEPRHINPLKRTRFEQATPVHRPNKEPLTENFYMQPSKEFVESNEASTSYNDVTSSDQVTSEPSYTNDWSTGLPTHTFGGKDSTEERMNKMEDTLTSAFGSLHQLNNSFTQWMSSASTSPSSPVNNNQSTTVNDNVSQENSNTPQTGF